MRILKQKYKVLIYAAAIILAAAGVLITAVTVAQGAEENRIIAEQSEKIDSGSALATPTSTEIPASTTARAVQTEMVIPASTTARAVQTETEVETPDHTTKAINVPGPEFITEEEAKEAYTLTAEEIFGLNVDRNELTAEFDGNPPRGQWRVAVTGKDTECYIDAISGEVLIFYSSYNSKYAGETITLEEYENDPAYGCEAYEDPDNAYNKAAAGIVGAKLANGRAIDEITVGATQFVWLNEGDGSGPEAKGTIQTDVFVIMDSGRCYVFSFLGTKEIVLNIFNSYPNKDACLNGYFYEEEAGMWESIDNVWQTAPGIAEGGYIPEGKRP